MDVEWTPGGVAPAVCVCVRYDVKRGPGRVSGRTVAGADPGLTVGGA